MQYTEAFDYFLKIFCYKDSKSYFTSITHPAVGWPSERLVQVVRKPRTTKYI